MNKTKLLPFLMLMVASLFSASHKPDTKERENNVSTNVVSSRSVVNGKYVIDTEESVIKWKCAMALAGKGGHEGYVNIAKGELIIEKGKLAEGNAEVDMNTMADEYHRSDNNLIEHLKSEDFFDVEKFPIATFAITRVASADDENITITGNLTIKKCHTRSYFSSQTGCEREGS